MKVPCEDCLVYPSCNDYCDKAREFMKKLDHDIIKFQRFVKSKNGNRKKNMKEQQRLHYNHLIDTWNYSVKFLKFVELRHFGFNPGDENGRTAK